MTVAFRITKRPYAATIWSGYGARDFGGRWNSKGVAVVYTAENRSLAALEQLVHLLKPRVLRGFVIASIEFDPMRIQWLDRSMLPANWRNIVPPRSLKAIGDDWVASATFPVLAVPSAVVVGEWNYLINPVHPEFHSMKKSSPEPFVYDERLK